MVNEEQASDGKARIRKESKNQGNRLYEITRQPDEFVGMNGNPSGTALQLALLCNPLLCKDISSKVKRRPLNYCLNPQPSLSIRKGGMEEPTEVEGYQHQTATLHPSNETSVSRLSRTLYGEVFAHAESEDRKELRPAFWLAPLW